MLRDFFSFFCRKQNYAWKRGRTGVCLFNVRDEQGFRENAREINAERVWAELITNGGGVQRQRAKRKQFPATYLSAPFTIKP